MKKLSLFIVAAIVLSGCATPKAPLTSNNYNMKLTSSAFEHEGAIPSKYTCDGDDATPPLTVSEVPEEAKSLALIADDPDAPSGTWVHWVVWNIAPSSTNLTGGTEGITSFGSNGYGGPCPPSGTHRYFFKVYALDADIDLPTSADKAALESAMQGHIVDHAELMGTYQRG